MFARSIYKTRASALVIVLAFIVLMSVVMLSYLATTQSTLRKSSSSAAIVETDMLAEVATTAIIDDIRQEMLAGADSTNQPVTNQPMTVSAKAMLPGRVLSGGIAATDTNFLNLTKQSLRTNAFYPGTSTATFTSKGSAAGIKGRARASSVSTTEASLNGRLVSAERWNKPMLISGDGFTRNDQLPDWILISRKGPLIDGMTLGNYTNKAVSNEDYVIGRYAYNVYDISGLLDINVAGFPANAKGDAATKGSMAWADLSVIPGMGSSTDIQKFVEWRNRLSLNSTNYADMVRTWGESHGFNAPLKQGSEMENHFFSRQDLIRFVKTYGSNSITPQALPYLTTYSAKLDQPSFSPASGRPKIGKNSGGGGNDAFGADDTINPNLAAYGDVVGSPVIKRRFPLDRLRYLQPNPTGEVAAKIRKYFGLVWSASGYQWTYSPGGGGGGTIAKLSEISGREANFFELLKAAVNAGTLGGQFQNNNPEEVERSPRIFGQEYGSINYQIMRLGAAIIDQYDADNFPTRISFDGEEFYGVEDLPYLYVIRNAAYRTGTVNPAVPAPTPKATPRDIPEEKDAYKALSGWGGRTTTYRYVMMMQPTLWNPHQAPAAGAPSLPGPTDFRIAADSKYGSVEVKTGAVWWKGSDYNSYYLNYYNDYPSADPKDSDVSTVFSPEEDYVDFNVASSGKAAFREPYTITSRVFPPGANATGSKEEDILADEEFNQDSDGSTTPTTSVTGFRVGNLWGGPTVTDDLAWDDTKTDNKFGKFPRFAWLLRNRIEMVEGVDFELKFKAPDGNYYTYDKIEAYSGTENPGWHDDILRPDGKGGRPIFRYGYRVDPRTERFGLRDGNTYEPTTFVINNGVKINTTTTYRHWLQGWTAWRSHPINTNGIRFGKAGNGMTVGHKNYSNWKITTANGTYYYWGHLAANNPTSEIRYPDADGVFRQAMGGQFNTANGFGLPTMQPSTVTRPVMLNRPFRSVAELGHVFRGQPWKQLDFWTPESGDAALLDVFSVAGPSEDEDPPLSSGKINLNTRRPEVLKALLLGTSKLSSDSGAGAIISDSIAQRIADELIRWTTSTASTEGPLRNRSELVGRYNSGTNFMGLSTKISDILAGDDRIIQLRRQNVLRALVDAGDTRTWTFLADIIVQSGKYAPGANLAKFSIEGEGRYWVYLSVDRFSGKVVSKYVEAVNE